MADPLTAQILDLDALVGGEVWVRVGGKERRFFALFTDLDMKQYQRMVLRLQRNAQRVEEAQRIITDWAEAVKAAEDAGKAPPVQPDISQFGAEHPDWYPDTDYDRDLFAILTRVWQASEAGKPEGERETVDENTVRGLVDHVRAKILLDRLWQSRFEPRASQPAPAPQPAALAPAIRTPSGTRRRSGRAA